MLSSIFALLFTLICMVLILSAAFYIGGLPFMRRRHMNSVCKKQRPWISKHLTEDQWKKHRLSYAEYLSKTGEYENFRGGTLGWLKREGLPPITVEMAAEMEKRNEKYENELVANGMVNELIDWRQRRIERRAAVEAIEVIAS